MKWPIARRITFALVALTITAVVAVSALGLVRESRNIRKLSGVTLKVIARTAAQRIDDLARTTMAHAAAFAESQAVIDLCRGEEAPRMTDFFQVRLARDANVSRITVLDAEGNVRASAPPGPPPETLPLAETLGGETRITGMMREGVYVTAPVISPEGPIIGVVVMRIDRARVRALLPDLLEGARDFSVVEETMPSGARVFVAHPVPELELQSRDALSVAQQIEAKNRWGRTVRTFTVPYWEFSGGTFRTKRDDTELEGAWHDCETLPWRVFTVLPREEFDSDIGEAFTQEAWTILIVLLLAVTVAWWQSRSILRPVRRLSNAAEQIAAGNLEARADIRTDDELGRLANVFDHMVPQLAETLQLKESLAIAGQVQEELLPKEAPAFDGFDVHGTTQPYEQIGGDFFDFLDLRPWNDDRFAVVIGDVVGHGIAAAMLMATARAHVRSRAQPLPELGALFDEINRRLWTDLGEEQFMTMALYAFNPKANRIDWCSAGQDAAFHYRAESGAVEERPNRNVPIGVLDDWTYTAASRDDLAVGDVLLIGTDGIWETRNATGEEFGKERVRALLAEHHDASARAITDALIHAVTAFRGDLPRQDDVTVVTIRRAPDAAR